MTPRDGFPDVRAMVEEILRTNPGASMETINRLLAKRMEAYNATPQPNFGGLSPLEMHQLLSGDWLTSGALRLNERLSLEDLADASLLADARTLLEYVAAEGSVKETARRNLTRAAVAALLPRLRSPQGRRAGFMAEEPPVRNEEDVFWLAPLRHCLLFAKLLVRRKGLRVSRHGQELLADDRAGELYALLFHTLFRTLNLAILTREDRHAALQSTVAYTFYRLKSQAREWKSSEALAESAWLESAKEPQTGWEASSGHDFRHYTLRHRVLDPLVEFGLLDDRAVPADEPLPDRIVYRVTPLFDRFLQFRFGREPERDPFLMQ